MFKVISAEIKKIVSKPGIFILAVLLAIVLVLGIFIYKPQNTENSAYTLEGMTFNEKYNDFMGNSIDSGYKVEAEKLINDTSAKIAEYTYNYKSQNMTLKSYINTILDEFDENFRDYQQTSLVTSHASDQYKTEIRNKLLTNLRLINTAIQDAINKNSSGIYAIVSTNKNFRTYETNYEEIYNIFNSTSNESEFIDGQCTEYKNTYETKFKNIINSFYYPTLNENLVNDYTSTSEESKFSIVKSRLGEIFTEINNLRSEMLEDESELNLSMTMMNKLEDLANKYTSTAKVFVNLLNYELLSNALSLIKTADQLDLLHILDISEYNAKSFLVRYEYLFDNNKTDDDFANPLTIGVSSNSETNAYDYTYFILRVFGFIIVVYAVMNLCHSISGEIKEGTLRYMAVRPISRFSLYMGKLFATLFMSSIMLIFSSLIAFAVGFGFYGMSSLTILTIFNGTTAIAIHPVVMIIIFLLSTLLEICVYASIAMLLSCLFKSDLLSVTLILVLYLINTIIPIFTVGANSWLAFYPFSHISLYSFFGSTMYNPINNFLSSIFGAKTYAGSNIGLTIGLIIGIFIVLNVIATRVFNKKEL